MDPQVDIVELLSDAFFISKSETKRKIKEGGFKVNGVKIKSEDFECTPENLDNKIISFGKKRFRKIIFDKSINDFQIWGCDK